MHANKVHFDRCPVRIEVPDLLVHLRTRVVDEARGGIPGPEALAMKAAALALATSGRFEKAQNAGHPGRSPARLASDAGSSAVAALVVEQRP